MTKIFSVLLCLLAQPAGMMLGGHSSAPARTLNIHFIDVEGGASTLIVTPAGESILVDAGWPGFENRDANRIRQAMSDAGVTQIDHMIATHYHADHYGGIPQLAAAVPIKHYYDHGKMSSLQDDPNFPKMYAAYQTASGGQTTTLSPGDTIPLKRAAGVPAVTLSCIVSGGQTIGGSSSAANPECASARAMEDDPSDNARSVGFVLSYGGFRFLDLGDLTWNVEQKLVCPADRIGHIDLYQVTHHGMSISNNVTLLRTVKPTVAVMDNGPRKGGAAETVKRLKELSSLQALYQLHRNVASANNENAAPEFIANLEEKPDAGYAITVAVDPTKHIFTVTNERTRVSTNYVVK
jgi:beta-lactamase superfamily II metal-dependent hydrolase